MTHIPMTMMLRRFRSGVFAATVVAALPCGVHAQGTLSAQGFGYPPGQLSTRAQGVGGAIGEIDPRSPLNPAALAIGASGQLYAQYDPELRSVTGPSGTSKTTTARFPNFGAILPITGHLVSGVSASTLLDRTWTTQSIAVHTIGASTDTSTGTTVQHSEGGITDVRVGLAYAFNAFLRVGVAEHGYTGSTRVGVTTTFADTLRYQTIVENAVLNYRGTAFSTGFAIGPLEGLSIAGSLRRGGDIRMRSVDTLVSTGKVPDHYALGVSYEGVPGALFAVRVAHDKWSSLNALSTSGAHGVDATDVSGGVEVTGPRVGENAIMIRLGMRRRTLPFTLGTNEIRESAVTGGLGIPFAKDRAGLDFAVSRAKRTGVTGIEESAYNLSFGLRVHP